MKKRQATSEDLIRELEQDCKRVTKNPRRLDSWESTTEEKQQLYEMFETGRVEAFHNLEAAKRNIKAGPDPSKPQRAHYTQDDEGRQKWRDAVGAWFWRKEINKQIEVFSSCPIAKHGRLRFGDPHWICFRKTWDQVRAVLEQVKKEMEALISKANGAIAQTVEPVRSVLALE